MDDSPNGRYSRAPELEDLTKLCQRLNEAGARYLLIGGFAVILHGFVRGTRDIDLLVDPSTENIQAVKKTLSSLPDNAAAEIADEEISRYAVVRIADEIVVDLMAKACGIDFDEAERSDDIETVHVQGIPIPVAGKRLLLRMKDTVRPSDAMDSPTTFELP
ncbi:MAG: hypothetical protein V3S30_03560 [Thermoanaerobaculia bacterium]